MSAQQEMAELKHVFQIL